MVMDDFNTYSGRTRMNRISDEFDSIVEGFDYKAIQKIDNRIRELSDKMSDTIDEVKKQDYKLQIDIEKIKIERIKLKGKK